ncbi:peptidoglycan recognition family protein [Actinomadura sp. B10D3]|uniref:peptidoglycan recognition protein family protein n=1 Tax=Actinomadura sp. B10D3 TaxID=3153557 RepID=UPI00325E3C11
MNAHSGEGASDREGAAWRVTRRSLIGGAVGAGLLEMLSWGTSHHNVAMADERLARPSAGDQVMFRAEAPHVYTRAQWNARPPRRPARILGRAPDRIIVHHTATANSKSGSLAHAFGLSRAIQNMHMDSNGWDDTGQQLTISRGGIVMEGRNRSLKTVRAGRLAVGAQVLHHNEHTIGIENEGTYMTKAVPDRLWSSLVEVCVWLCQQYSLDPSSAIIGHRDLNNTSCPGDVLYARLPELRKAVAARLGSSAAKAADGSGSVLQILPPLGNLG